MILGLDISTSITGVSIVDRDNELIYCDAWRTDKKGLSHFDKLDIKLIYYTFKPPYFNRHFGINIIWINSFF